jgi:hypothetical protein
MRTEREERERERERARQTDRQTDRQTETETEREREREREDAHTHMSPCGFCKHQTIADMTLVIVGFVNSPFPPFPLCLLSAQRFSPFFAPLFFSFNFLFLFYFF